MLKIALKHHPHLPICSTLHKCQVITKVAMGRYSSIDIYAAEKILKSIFLVFSVLWTFFLEGCEWSPDIESQLTKLLVKNRTWMALFSSMPQEHDLLHRGKEKELKERGFSTTWLRWELLVLNSRNHWPWQSCSPFPVAAHEVGQSPFTATPAIGVEELRRFWQCNL